MALAPADRYRNAGELADDLRRFTTDQLVGAHRYTLAQRVRRFVRRHGAIVGMVVLSCAFGAWSLWSYRRERAGTFEAAQRELAVQAAGIQHDVAFSLDQADPILGQLRLLADPDAPLDVIAPRMQDLTVGRPGVANVSLGFPNGLMRGTFAADQGEIQMQESRVGDKGTTRHNYRHDAAGIHDIAELTTDYDVRKRSHYLLAQETKARVWTPPRTYFTSHSTGITCVEPIYGADGQTLRAVATVDFDVGALSGFVSRAPLEGARTVVFSGDGTILAFPSAPLPEIARREDRLLRYDDFDDPALTALFDALKVRGAADGLRFLELRHGAFLAAVAPIGGKRAGIATPLDWYVATLVPADRLLGPAHARARQSLYAMGGALLVTALAIAWQLGRRRVAAR
jgi:hypothetical protein